MYSFKFFSPDKPAYKCTARLKKTQVIFNTDACSALGNPEYVIVGYDESAKVIGVQPVAEITSNSIKFTNPKKGNGGAFSASRMYLSFGINIEALIPEGKVSTMALECHWNNEINMLIIDLKPLVALRNGGFITKS